jgi:hypothetical protein
MPTNPQTPNGISSASGRRWLHEAKKAARKALSDQNFENPVNAPKAFQTTRVDDAEELPFSKSSQVTPQPVHEIVTVAIPFVGKTVSDEAVPQTTERLSKSHLLTPAAEKTPPVTTNDSNTTDDKNSTSKVSRVPTIDPPPTKSAITDLVDQIIERFPVQSASIILFASTEQSSHTDETCARVAAELAGRQLGSILLVDSDFDNQNLTIAGGMREKPGVREIVSMGMDWERTILRNRNSKLDFMPSGVTKQPRWDANRQLHLAAAKMKKDYQFTCVSIGDAHGKAAKLWSQVCDATYLLVSVRNSNQDIAKSAVRALTDAGARLQGCIVTETA